MTDLPFAIERSVLIRASAATVFRFFTESERFARWWGAGSSIEPRVGGKVEIRYPNGVVARGEVLAIEPERSIAFTFGYESGQPFAPGASRVEIALRSHAEGTSVELRHEVPDRGSRDAHEPGWRYQLAVFAAVVADDVAAELPGHLEAWFRAWNAAYPGDRRAALTACCAEDVGFRDRHGLTHGIADLLAHIDAARRHMPGLTLVQGAPPMTAHDTAVVPWELRSADGSVLVRGCNVYRLEPGGRFADVVGVSGKG